MNAKSPTIDIWKPISMLNNRVSNKTYYASQLGNIRIINHNRNNDRHIKAGKLGRKRVFKYDLKGDIIEEYDSLTECAKITGYAISTISNCCNHYKFCVGNYIYLHEYDNFNDHVNKFKS